MDVANKNSDTSSFKPSFNYKLTSDYFNTNKYKYNLCICYLELQFSAGTGSVWLADVAPQWTGAAHEEQVQHEYDGSSINIKIIILDFMNNAEK